MNLEAWIVCEGYALDELNLIDKNGEMVEPTSADYVEFTDWFVVHVTELRVVDYEINDDEPMPRVIVELDI